MDDDASEVLEENLMDLSGEDVLSSEETNESTEE